MLRKTSEGSREETTSKDEFIRSCLGFVTLCYTHPGAWQRRRKRTKQRRQNELAEIGSLAAWRAAQWRSGSMGKSSVRGVEEGFLARLWEKGLHEKEEEGFGFDDVMTTTC